jgi:undecaprenyl diphosphate synthase
MEGHRVASESVRSVIEACPQLGVRALTLYTFSAENWKRPALEVDAIMHLIEENLRRELPELHQKDVRIRAVGRLHELPPSLQNALSEAMSLTANNQRLTVNLALNYGGRAELIDAARAIAERVAKKELKPSDIDEALFAHSLYAPDIPDPDLLIRTGGEMRVSNYLLWQIAYTEIWVTPVLWPDFRGHHFEQAIADYKQRQRRFGGVP